MKKILFIIVTLLTIAFIGTSKTNADENIVLDLDRAEIIEVSKEQIISNYSELNGINFEEASTILFPDAPMTTFRSAFSNDDTTYVMLKAAFQDKTLIGYVPESAGQVYFYCEVSTSGWFRGIQRIIYAGYHSGDLVFSGNFQYHLADPNRIHYTLSGGLYSNTTTTTSSGGSVGLGEVGSIEVTVSSTTSYVKKLYYHGDVRY